MKMDHLKPSIIEKGNTNEYFCLMKSKWRIHAGMLFILVSFISCFQPQRNCEKYRTGTFEFETYLNGEMVTSRFTRNDSIEIDEFQGEIDTSSIRWINDCEYIARNLNPKNMAERQPLHIKILTTSKDGYKFEYGLVGEARKERGEVKFIKE